MGKEQYQPSEEEIKKAEEMMTGEEKERSEEREVAYEAGQESIGHTDICKREREKIEKEEQSLIEKTFRKTKEEGSLAYRKNRVFYELETLRRHKEKVAEKNRSNRIHKEVEIEFKESARRWKKGAGVYLRPSARWDRHEVPEWFLDAKDKIEKGVLKEKHGHYVWTVYFPKRQIEQVFHESDLVLESDIEPAIFYNDLKNLDKTTLEDFIKEVEKYGQEDVQGVYKKLIKEKEAEKKEK